MRRNDWVPLTTRGIIMIYSFDLDGHTIVSPADQDQPRSDAMDEKEKN